MIHVELQLRPPSVEFPSCHITVSGVISENVNRVKVVSPSAVIPLE
jgi:hypothetical protein